MARGLLRWAGMRMLWAVAVVVLGGCTTELVGTQVDGDDPYTATSSLVGDGRWQPAADVLAVGAAAPTEYDGAPAWEGGASCGGGLLPGAAELGAWLESHFAISGVDGYACRPNTADTSKLSVHGTGRALDVFVPVKADGSADNAAGDPIAAHLIMHAEEIGIQLVIWDRTKWSRGRSGRRDSAYTGPHPHHDHLHVELTEEGAAQETRWFEAARTTCEDTCTWAGDGECDDGGSGALWSVCALGSDCSDCGPR